MILSATQAEKFQDCQRKWWFEYIRKIKPPSTLSQAEGIQGHSLTAEYLLTGKMPGRVKLGKVVTAAILAGNLPTLGPDLTVEQRFDGGKQRDAEGNWLPLNLEKTLWVGGQPWDGAIDLKFRRADIPEIWDHKFSSDIEAYALAGGDLIKTIQMPLYALEALRQWPDAKEFRLVHHYVQKTGVKSFVRQAVVSTEQVLERGEQIAGVVKEIVGASTIEQQNDVPAANRNVCEKFGGCPHQSICNAYKEKKKVQLSKEELALFGELEETIAPKKADITPTPIVQTNAVVYSDTKAIRIELGPETLAILKGLLTR